MVPGAEVSALRKDGRWVVQSREPAQLQLENGGVISLARHYSGTDLRWAYKTALADQPFSLVGDGGNGVLENSGLASTVSHGYWSAHRGLFFLENYEGSPTYTLCLISKQ